MNQILTPRGRQRQPGELPVKRSVRRVRGQVTAGTAERTKAAGDREAPRTSAAASATTLAVAREGLKLQVGAERDYTGLCETFQGCAPPHRGAGGRPPASGPWGWTAGLSSTAPAPSWSHQLRHRSVQQPRGADTTQGPRYSLSEVDACPGLTRLLECFYIVGRK